MSFQEFNKKYTASMASEAYLLKAFTDRVADLTETEVRELLTRPELTSDQRLYVERWLAKVEADRNEVWRAEERTRREREVSAAERAALSADRSANWARVAGLIALAALFFAAWPYFRAFQ